ncbi:MULTISPECIES: DNA cytosine methyltransferase [Actinosynnema]|uniref:DNA cytosine methyltransferase n=1 Tax=Actinosynnema TaxID=40566 RepID=UPI0026467137|nr:DNA cytosine methyltransferase [Actinosynnema pretiosum]MCP2098987.1 DNA (cytosine-5)-methyltransferase 1 [Actinosynnema pretiosum]
MSLTFTDIFCGAGGSSIGLSAAGFTLKLAANHWARAIDTHAANFPDAEHLCADVSNYPMRSLPRTDVLWASPICTEISPAGGRRRQRAQLDLLDHAPEPVAAAGFERTRATFHDVIRATEVHRYRAVIVENVVNVATDWQLFDWWLTGMKTLGYQVQFVSVSSAHVGDQANPHAPQWRDRLYMVFTRDGVPLPDVTPRPQAWCFTCERAVRAKQVWRRPRVRRIGKYGQQYDYRCPRAACRHALVEPYVLPASAAIDWNDLGERIGERARPLTGTTMTRIRAGLAMFAGEPTMVTVTHGQGEHGRAYPASAGPLPTRTAKIGDGLACPPMLVPSGGTWRTQATPAATPMPARTTSETDALLCPPGTGGRPAPADALVIPYRRGAKPHRPDRPISTLATRASHGLLHTDLRIEDCRYQMLRPREQLRAQRFPDSYTVTGNVSEQTMQAGNAVSANVAQWLGTAVAHALA